MDDEPKKPAVLTLWQISLMIAFADGKAAGKRGRNKTSPLYLSREFTDAWLEGYRKGYNEL